MHTTLIVTDGQNETKLASIGWPNKFLPLDEAVASGTVFSLYSGRTSGRKRFWSHINNSKTVNGELIGTHGRAIEWTIPNPPRTPNRGVANRRPQNEHIMWGGRAA